MARDPESFDLHGRVAVVTGASKGIGRAIARLLGRQGAAVVVSSRRQEAVDLTVAAFREDGIEATAIAAHMGDPAQVEGLVQHTIERYGGIDIVVNNAAINPVFGPILQTDDAVFDKIMQVNVKGPMQLARLAHASMKARGGGSVVNISSIEGLTPGHGLGLYSISKASLIAATRVMAREWGPDGIRVNAICPGLVETKFSEALTGNEKILKMVLAKQSLPQVATPEDISGLALFLASDASSFCTGGVFTADGGYTI
jgi:NAD(P)-dependent dehydrogenase (short-subunit alcohol dehydrogenase family)